jgi:cytochrome c oxidase subunit 2
MSVENGPGREHPPQVRQMLLIGAVVSALGIALALLIDWFPIQASKEGARIDTLWDVLLIASVPIFVLVETIVLYCAIKFRMRPGEELKDGPPIHGNTKLEIVWTAIPAILLVGLCTYAYVVLTDIEEAPAAGNQLNVRVVGEQFTWTFYVEGEDGKEVKSNQLYLPNNRPVYFTVQSKDVIHDFWVPAFRMKIDAVPGIDTHLRVTPNRVGNYPVVCAELCGLGHSTMRQTAHVLDPGDWEQKIKELAAGPQGGGGGGGGGGGAAATEYCATWAGELVGNSTVQMAPITTAVMTMACSAMETGRVRNFWSPTLCFFDSTTVDSNMVRPANSSWRRPPLSSA